MIITCIFITADYLLLFIIIIFNYLFKIYHRKPLQSEHWPGGPSTYQFASHKYKTEPPSESMIQRCKKKTATKILEDTVHYQLIRGRGVCAPRDSS